MNSTLYDAIVNKEHHKYRRKIGWNLADKYSKLSLSPIERMRDRFTLLCDEEKPVILEGEQIVFTRTIENVPDIFTEEEWRHIKGTHYIHELGYLSNLSPNYYKAI